MRRDEQGRYARPSHSRRGSLPRTFGRSSTLGTPSASRAPWLTTPIKDYPCSSGRTSSSAKLREIEAERWVSVYFMLPAEFKGLCLSGRAVVDPRARAALWVLRAGKCITPRVAMIPTIRSSGSTPFGRGVGAQA